MDPISDQTKDAFRNMDKLRVFLHDGTSTFFKDPHTNQLYVSMRDAFNYVFAALNQNCTIREAFSMRLSTSRSYKAATVKAQALLKRTQEPHTVWWHHQKRRHEVSSTAWVEKATKAGQFGGKSRVCFTFRPL